MRHRRDLPAALLLLTLGCAGKIAPVDVGDPWGTPDAATCALFTCVADCDANPCLPTPADVACSSNADCTSFEYPSCACSWRVYGVNNGAIAELSRDCPAPPCVVVGEGTCPVDAALGPYTQDCQSAPHYPWSVACVDHQCRTYVSATGSE
jgi:hypothetical protein